MVDRAREQAEDRLGRARRDAADGVQAVIAQAEADARQVLDDKRGLRRARHVRHLPDLVVAGPQTRTRVATSAPSLRAADQAAARWVLPGVAVAMLLAGLLGSLRLGFHQMWFDEAFSILFVRTDWSYFWDTVWAKELNAVAYYVLLRGWSSLFGYTETALRALSVLLVVATVPVVALLARRLFGARAAIAAAALLAVHGGLLRFAQVARTYPLVTLLVALAGLLFVTAVQQGRWRHWLGFAAVAGLAVYGHLFAMFATFAMVASLVALPPAQVRWTRLATALGLYGVLLVPTALFLPRAETQQFDWVAGQMDGVFSRSVFFLAGDATPLVVTLTTVAGVLLALSLARRAALRGRDTETWAQALVLLWAVLPLMLAFGLSQVRPLLVPRYLIVAVPGVVLVLSAVLRLIWGSRTLAAVTVAALALQLTALPSQLYREPPANEAWRDLAETIAAQATPTDGLIVLPASQRATLEYYLTLHPTVRRDPATLPAPLSPPEPWGTQDPYGGLGRLVTDAAQQHDRVWVVVHWEHDPTLLAQQHAALAGWDLADRSAFGRVVLRRYERR